MNSSPEKLAPNSKLDTMTNWAPVRAPFRGLGLAYEGTAIQGRGGAVRAPGMYNLACLSCL